MITKAASDVAELVQETPDSFLLHRRVHTDPEVFELELEKIFYRTWVYVGHESELARPGDYKTTFIGRQPVLVTRHAVDGQIYVLHNRCRHRGTMVCLPDRGNANFFTCSYHGWTYNTRGDLVRVPEIDGYPPSFDPSQLGLVPVPRVDSYAGLIFASLSPEGPGLQEHLGNARIYLDLLTSRGPLELAKIGVHRVGYDGNWKFQMDNNTDSYHVPTLHKSWRQIQERQIGRGATANAHRRMRSLGNGHGTGETGDDALEPGYDPRSDPWRPWQMSVFPNISILTLTFFGPQLRVIQPIAVDRTEVRHYPFVFPDEPRKLEQLRWYEFFYGPAGTGNPDDREMFERLQRGLQSRGSDWQVLSRGMHGSVVDERGIGTDPHMGEAGQRSFYREWKRLIAAA